MNSTGKILVAPLDWGLGHASRCVPLIRLLTDRGAEVLLSACGRSSFFLKAEFPQLTILPARPYPVTYPAKGSMALHMARLMPAVLRTIRHEHRELQQQISDHGIGAVISDNRFGMWSVKVPSIYITHQLSVLAPKPIKFAGRWLSRRHRKFISHFDECWIPDFEDNGGLSGDLSHPARSPVPAYYIGLQSRFRPGKPSRQEYDYDLMVVISGPEPQRGIFEDMVMQQLRVFSGRALVVLGKPEEDIRFTMGKGIEIRGHMGTQEMQEALMRSELVISRPGYTSIMDLAILGKRAAFVPTPGQTEQEYLAAYHAMKRNYYSMPQAVFNIGAAVKASRNYPGLQLQTDAGMLEQRVDELLQRMRLPR